MDGLCLMPITRSIPILLRWLFMDVGSTRYISIRTNLLPQSGTISGCRSAVRKNRNSLIGKGYRAFGRNRFDKRDNMCYSISIEYVLWQLGLSNQGGA